LSLNVLGDLPNRRACPTTEKTGRNRKKSYVVRNVSGEFSNRLYY
jgi:hypothetical protein